MTPKLWQAYGSGLKKNDRGLKIGFTKLTTKKEIALPTITITQKVAFAILCALEVYKETNFVTWANNWLSNKDRTDNAALIFKYDVTDAAWYAVNAAWYAANAACFHKNINLIKIAKKAMKY